MSGHHVPSAADTLTLREGLSINVCTECLTRDRGCHTHVCTNMATCDRSALTSGLGFRGPVRSEAWLRVRLRVRRGGDEGGGVVMSGKVVTREVGW